MNFAPESTTVRKAGSVMAEPLGLEWPRDRERIVKKINEMRLEIRNRYPEAPIFRECAYVVPLFGIQDTPGRFTGFTLPEDVASLSAVWFEDEATVLRSRWREAHTGIISKSAIEVEVVPMMHSSPTEADICPEGDLLQFKASLECDDGKRMEVRIKKPCGQEKRLRVPLNSKDWMTSKSRVVEIISVILPEDLCGTVTLREQSSRRVLSIYQPGYEVPAYQRFKVATGCPGKHSCVVIKGPKVFKEVHADTDIVEIGDLNVLKYAASYLRYSDTTTDRSDLQRANFDLQKMGEQLNGVMARLEGNSQQDGPVYMGRITRPRNRLNGYSKR